MGLKNFPIICAAFVVVLNSPPAVADEQHLQGQRLSANCTGCHGAGGVVVGSALPNLAGQSKEALITSMNAFKAGTRNTTIMHQISKGYSAEQIEFIAAYFAAQNKQKE